MAYRTSPNRRRAVRKAVKALRERRKVARVCRNGDGRPVFKADRCEPCYDEHKRTNRPKATNADDTSPEQTTTQTEAVESSTATSSPTTEAAS